MIVLLLSYASSSTTDEMLLILLLLTACSIFLVLVRLLASASAIARLEESEKAVAHQMEIQRREYKIEYEYDRFNNMTSMEKTNLITGEVLESHTFAYDNDDWTDQLTSADGQTVTYDGAGNVSGVGNTDYTWKAGNQLASINGDGKKYFLFL